MAELDIRSDMQLLIYIQVKLLKLGYCAFSCTTNYIVPIHILWVPRHMPNLLVGHFDLSFSIMVGHMLVMSCELLFEPLFS